MNINQIIGTNIRGYRQKMDWTQEKLSVRSGVTSQYISRIEIGEENPSVNVLETLAKALEVDMHLLFVKRSYEKK